MGRYVVRVFADREQNNSTDEGTLVQPLDVQMSYYTDSADAAEKRLSREAAEGKIPKGRVYQICPSVASFEPIRSCAIALDGCSKRVFLDPAGGLYSVTRRIRFPHPSPEQPQERPVSMGESA